MKIRTRVIIAYVNIDKTSISLDLDGGREHLLYSERRVRVMT